MVDVKTTWVELKGWISRHQIQSVWVENEATTYVTVFVKVEDSKIYASLEKPSTDYDDYVANYEPTKNSKMYLDESVSVQTTETRYRPRFAMSTGDTTLSKSSYADIFDVNVDGKIDALNLNFDRDDVFVQIEVDGVVIYDEENERLESNSDYGLDGSDWIGGDDD